MTEIIYLCPDYTSSSMRISSKKRNIFGVKHVFIRGNHFIKKC